MARRAFYSFHYQLDNWRASQIRNIGVIAGNPPATDNDWETITSSGSRAIQRWIDGQLRGCDCTVLLIGTKTAGRKWIDYEIEHSWNSGKGIVGIYVHSLKDQSGETASKGDNPLDAFQLEKENAKRKPENMSVFSEFCSTALSDVVKVHDPNDVWDLWDGSSSTEAYATIKKRLSDWVEEAIRIREKHLARSK